MTLKIIRNLLLFACCLYPRFSLSEECTSCDNTITATATATEIFLSWCLHCEVPNNDANLVDLYRLQLGDLTTGRYNESISAYCKDMHCETSHELARPCINYSISLEAVVWDGDQEEAFQYEPKFGHWMSCQMHLTA